MQTLRTILRRIFFVPLALLLLFEEWGWEPLAAAFGRFARLPLWAAVERAIAKLPPALALLAFGVPMLTLLPIKLLAIYLFGLGKTTLGLLLLITAKIGGTAIMARLFQLTQPALLQLRWFAWWYPRWKAWKDALLEELRRSALGRSGQALKRSVKLWWRTRWD